ncbi:MAG: tyrosine-type recombinase/integrase [Chloroflexi bacterium]|nr:tyrosine-type recombinase/integrase [Chloroflexota bacterium]
MAKRPGRRGWHDVDKTDIRVSELLQQFLMHQEDRNHSPKTVRWYSDMLGRFVTSLPTEARLRDIDAASIRVYLHDNRQNGASKFTLHAYARTLKTFLRWLYRESYVDEELHRHIQMPKVPSYNDVTIDVLSDEEITHLLSFLDPSTDVGCRDRAIVCLMLESALRLKEVTGLELNDVHLKEMYLKVRGKGDKESYVPIGPTTEKALNRYAAHFRIPADPKTKAYFLNIFGEPLGYEAVKSTFDRLAKRSGISRLHPHLLRHTAATRMLANGADLHTVQRMLRHSDIRTTLRYLHLVTDQLQEKMQMFSPLAGIGDQRRRMVPTRPRTMK